MPFSRPATPLKTSKGWLASAPGLLLTTLGRSQAPHGLHCDTRKASKVLEEVPIHLPQDSVLKCPLVASALPLSTRLETSGKVFIPPSLCPYRAEERRELGEVPIERGRWGEAGAWPIEGKRNK